MHFTPYHYRNICLVWSACVYMDFFCLFLKTHGVIPALWMAVMAIPAFPDWRAHPRLRRTGLVLMLAYVRAHYVTSRPSDWLIESTRPSPWASSPTEGGGRGGGGGQLKTQPRPLPTSLPSPLITKRGSIENSGVFSFFGGVSARERGWPRARQTRRARPSSSRANTSSSTECGCRPSAGGRWRRSPTSPWEAATSGSSPTPSQVRLGPCFSRSVHIHISLREISSSRILKANSQPVFPFSITCIDYAFLLFLCWIGQNVLTGLF